MTGPVLIVELALFVYLMFSVWEVTRENLTRHQQDRRSRRSADAAPKDRARPRNLTLEKGSSDVPDTSRRLPW